MRKCTHCQGCLKTVWLYNQTYKYCGLCRLVYKVFPGGKLELVEDQVIITTLFNLVGNRI